MLSWLWELSLPEAIGVFLIGNVVIFGLSVALCWGLGRGFADKRLFETWQPLRFSEGLAAGAAVILNAAVSVVGWLCWKNGWLVLVEKTWWLVLVDLLVMTLAMDFGMYVLHRLAHHPLIYPLFHTFHHRHETTNPLSLFVLHPLEVLGFGGLMIMVLLLYPMSPPALIAYLTLNVLFGTLGHSGVEPLPRRLREVPVLRWLGTSTFHAGHHAEPGYNFGFYTLLWDRLFGTLQPGYFDRFGLPR